MELVEEVTIGAIVQMAVISECSDGRPVGVFVGDTPRTDFDQNCQAAVVAQ